MRFKSDPGRVLTDSRTHRVIGKFDGNGIYETDDPYYVGRLKLLFPIAEGKGSKPVAEKRAAAAGKDETPKMEAAPKKAVKA